MTAPTVARTLQRELARLARRAAAGGARPAQPIRTIGKTITHISARKRQDELTALYRRFDRIMRSMHYVDLTAESSPAPELVRARRLLEQSANEVETQGDLLLGKRKFLPAYSQWSIRMSPPP